MTSWPLHGRGWCFSSDDIDVLVPWNIAGRYPADLGEPDPETAASAVDAAGRIVDGLSRQVLPGG